MKERGEHRTQPLSPPPYLFTHLHTSPHLQESSLKDPQLRSLYKTPVLGEVRGTYALAPLEGYKLETSPETLITCIMKVREDCVCVCV